jgi:hypothetical protein
MASMARDNRRRRVLNEEVRSASASSLGSSAAAPAADTPRYGEQASIEHHPQITDFIPRRKRAVLTTLALGAGVAAGAQLFAHNAAAVASVVPGVMPQQVARQLAEGVVAWSSAVALLLAAALARITFSLRRHRVNDVRGRYRVWRWIAGGAMLASVNAVVGFHTVFARAAAEVTGWSLTTSAAEWWLAPAALVGGWVGMRLLFEIAESRSSVAMTLLGGVAYAAAAAGALGWAPSALGAWSGALAGALPLVGHAVFLAAMMIFARYVVLDVQGLIEHKPRAAKVKKPRAAKGPSASASATPAPAAKAAIAARTAVETWSGEGDEEEDEDNDEGDRYMSKSDRKRLRKQQLRQGRAA